MFVVLRKAFRIFNDQFYDVMFIDRFERIMLGFGDGLQNVLKISFFHGVMDNKMARKFFKYIRVSLRLGIKLPECLMVRNQFVDNTHKSSNGVMGLKVCVLASEY